MTGKSVDADSSWDYEDMMTVKKVAVFSDSSKFCKVLCVCYESDEAVITTVVDVIELARGVVVTKRKNAKSADREKNKNNHLNDVRTVMRTICKELEAAKGLVKALKVHLAYAGAVVEKLVDDAAKTETHPSFCIIVME